MSASPGGPGRREAFTLADCAAALALHADWAYEIPPVFTNLRAYRAVCWPVLPSPGW